MPFDNIKTRLQSRRADYKGMIDCVADCLRNEGIGAFWRGTTPRLVRLTVRGRRTSGYASQN
jgi:solute carrier family 25 citrate transporter 1